MKTIKALLHVVAILGLAASSALAGVSAGITNVVFSGPGGTGSSGLTSGTLVEPILDYTALNYIDMTITVNGAGSFNINEAPGFGAVRNHTGQTWTSFDLSVQPGSIGGFANDWSDGSSSFASLSDGSLDVFFSNGSVADGSSAFEPFGLFTTPSSGTFTIRETPAAAPEPSSCALVALGIFGLGFRRRLA